MQPLGLSGLLRTLALASCLQSLFCARPIIVLEDDDNEDGDHPEVCTVDMECPDLMQCESVSQLCVCRPGFSFSSPFASCESSKSVFRNFRIVGPSEVVLPAPPGGVHFDVEIGKLPDGEKMDEDDKWRYKWVVQKGNEFATVAGKNTQRLTLTHLKPGYIQFVLSLNSHIMEGYRSHNVTIVGIMPRIGGCLTEARYNNELFVWKPREQLRLCSNATFSSRPVGTWKWVRIDRNFMLPVDMSGSGTPELKLSNLHATNGIGPYEFMLIIADMRQRSANTTIKVHVRPSFPALLTTNRTVQLPVISLQLKAWVADPELAQTNAIAGVRWEQVGGPAALRFRNPKVMNASIEDFKYPGVYKFRIVVTNVAGGLSEATAFISVEYAKSGGDGLSSLQPFGFAANASVQLPAHLALLEVAYTKSVDFFQWIPHPDMPARMVMLGNSSHERRLMLTNLVAGRHLFTLVVSNRWYSASSTVGLVITEAPQRFHWVELRLENDANRRELTIAEQEALGDAIAHILTQNLRRHIEVTFTGVAAQQDWRDERQSGETKVLLMAETQSYPDHHYTPLHAQEVVTILRHNSEQLSRFRVLRINAFYCVSACSGHGLCSNVTRRCECNAFWMPSPFVTGDDRLDSCCTWPIVVVWLPLIGLSVLGFRLLQGHLRDSESQATALQCLMNELGGDEEEQQQRQISPYAGRFSPIRVVRRRRKKNNKPVRKIVQSKYAYSYTAVARMLLRGCNGVRSSAAPRKTNKRAGEPSDAEYE